eukprot:3271016-Amphidinium_carterae.1
MAIRTYDHVVRVLTQFERRRLAPCMGRACSACNTACHARALTFLLWRISVALRKFVVCACQGTYAAVSSQACAPATIAAAGPAGIA